MHISPLILLIRSLHMHGGMAQTVSYFLMPPCPSVLQPRRMATKDLHTSS